MIDGPLVITVDHWSSCIVVHLSPFARCLLARIQQTRVVDYVRIAFRASLRSGHVRREHFHVLVVGLEQVQSLPDKVKPPLAVVAVDVVHVLDVLVRVLLKELDYGVRPLLFERTDHVRGQPLILVHLARPPAIAQLHPHDVAVAEHPALFAHLGRRLRRLVYGRLVRSAMEYNTG